MRLLFLSICIVLVVPLSLRGQLQFDKQYAVGYDNWLSCHIHSLPDSSYLFVNHSIDSAKGPLYPRLARLDKSGNLLQNKVYKFQTSFWTQFGMLNHFIAATPSSYFLVGSIIKNSRYASVMLKINRATLDTIVSVTYEHPLNDFNLSNFIKIHNNKYILWGTKYWPNTNQMWPFALVLDSNLTVTSTQQLPLKSFQATGAVWNPISSRILLSGRLTPYSPHENVFLQEVDTLGVLTNSCITSSSYSIYASNFYFSPLDTSYVMTGYQVTKKFGGTYKGKLNLTKYGSDLNLRWRKSYGSEVAGDLSGATILSDGSIVASGTHDPIDNGNVAGLLLKVNMKGVVQWCRSFDHHSNPYPSTEYLYHLTPTYDQGFAAIGVSGSSWLRKAWAVKTNSLGCVTPVCQNYTLTVDSMLLDPPPPVTVTVVGDAHSQSTDFSVFPNPSATGFTFKRSAATDQELTVRISDVVGRLLHREELGSSTEITLGSGLTTGIYILTALNKSGVVIYRHRILKE